jgi:hypothetical protein
MSKITYIIELANKIERGRCVGNLYGVARYIDGCRNTWVLQPQPSEELAEQTKQRLRDEQEASK